MVFFIALTVLAMAALLAAEHHEVRWGVWLAKPLASTGFVGTALAAGALESVYGRWVLAALVLSWLGDFLLIPRQATRIFRAGILSFLLGHLAFACAFVLRGINVAACALSILALVLTGLRVLRWLQPHVPPGMRVPVYAYVVVISAMVAFAVGTAGDSWKPAILLGALLFYVSDLSVARDRFVIPTFGNRAWGLPAYYGAQLLLASTVS